jgi:hypothetical protein
MAYCTHGHAHPLACAAQVFYALSNYMARRQYPQQEWSADEQQRLDNINITNQVQDPTIVACNAITINAPFLHTSRCFPPFSHHAAAHAWSPVTWALHQLQ